MKFVLLALLGLSAVSAFVVKSQESILAELKNRVIPAEAEQLTGAALADYVNSQQKSWTASPSKFTMEKMLSKLMDNKYTEAVAEEDIAPEIQLDTIPDFFDARKNWTYCPSISYIRDQSDCGACWSFGAAEAMSDRTCIASKGKVSPILSADDILSCCGSVCGNGCQGGYPIQAWKFWNTHGVCTGANYADKNTCKPYPIAPCGHHKNETYYGPCPQKEYDTPKCTSACLNTAYKTSYTADKHYGASAYGVARSVAAIQKEIIAHGPVEAAYTVYEDFYQYTGGVYVHTGGKKLGGHAVRILGWGTDEASKNPYWLVANSWNTDWGEQGYFRILRGVNECGIEGAIVAGLAKV